MSGQSAARFRRTLVIVKRPIIGPSSLEQRQHRDSHRGQVDKSGLATR